MTGKRASWKNISQPNRVRATKALLVLNLTFLHVRHANHFHADPAFVFEIGDFFCYTGRYSWFPPMESLTRVFLRPIFELGSGKGFLLD